MAILALIELDCIKFGKSNFILQILQIKFFEINICQLLQMTNCFFAY